MNIGKLFLIAGLVGAVALIGCSDDNGTGGTGGTAGTGGAGGTGGTGGSGGAGGSGSECPSADDVCETGVCAGSDVSKALCVSSYNDCLNEGGSCEDCEDVGQFWCFPG